MRKTRTGVHHSWASKHQATDFWTLYSSNWGTVRTGSDHKRPQRSLKPGSKQGAATSRPGFGRMGGLVCAQNKNGWTPLYTRHHSVQHRSASTHLRCIWPHRRREKLEPTQPLLTRHRCHQPPWTIERQGVSHTGMREGGTSHPRFLQHFRVAWGAALDSL